MKKSILQSNNNHLNNQCYFIYCFIFSLFLIK